MSVIINIYIPTIENLSFHLARVMIIGSMDSGKTRMLFHNNSSKNSIKLKKVYAEKFSKKTGIEI